MIDSFPYFELFMSKVDTSALICHIGMLKIVLVKCK